MAKKGSEWTKADEFFLAANYGRGKVPYCMKALNRTEDSIRTKVCELGLTGDRIVMTEEEKKKIRELNEQGHNDCQIARVLGKSHRSIGRYRQKLGLKSPYHDQQALPFAKEMTRKRVEARKQFAREYNLPEDLHMRQVMILVYLVGRNGSSSAGIAAHLKIRAKYLKERKYITDLLRRGLIHKIRHEGQYRYFLAETAISMLAEAGGK